VISLLAWGCHGWNAEAALRPMLRTERRMDSETRPAPDPADEVWGVIAFLLVAAFLGDLPAAILAFAVLIKRHR
jgi:hypothetical protein